MTQKPSSPAPNQVPPKEPLNVFLSYAHKDEEWKEELEVHLSALKRQGEIVLWQDRALEPGTEWDAEIKAQLEAAHIILLLVSARFMASEYIYTQELTRAMERHEAKTARVIPIILKPVDFEGTPFAKLQALPKNAKPITRWDDPDEAFVDVAKGLRKVLKSLTVDLKPKSAGKSKKDDLGYLSLNVPRLPPKFLPRTEAMAGLKAKVLGDTSQPVAVTGSRRGVSIQGMGGIGKSVLAAAIARDPSVRQAFPDGVYWVSLGQEPQLLGLQTALAKDLGEQAPAFSEVADGKRWLREKLASQTCLVVLDDIWQEAHLAAFDVCGEQGQLLITTRDGGLVTGIGAVENSLDVLSQEQARNLLAGWTGCDVAELPIAADEIARECGYLPLALAMAGAMLKRSRRWEGVLQRLRRADLEKIKQQFPDYAYPDLLKMLQVSVDALEPEIQARYLDFAVFAEDARIPEAVLGTFWAPAGLDDLDTADVIDALISKSLLRRDEQGQLLLHDLQHDYITKQIEDSPELHQRLLDAYRDCCAGDWAKGPDDGYFFGQLARHLSEAGQLDELKELLVEYDWLQAHLKVTGINGLLDDYCWHTEDDVLGLVKSTLQLSGHILAPHPEQLTERLWGHLRDNATPLIQSLLEKAAAKKKNSWLQPRRTSLTPPGGPLLRTLLGHRNSVTSVAISTDGKRALSGSSDSTLKWWDLESGKELLSLVGHNSAVNSVAISTDGKHALSGSWDSTLKWWDLESGKELFSLKGHSNSVTSVAISTDSKRVLSGSWDNTLKWWGKELISLKGHSNSVTSVAISTDGKRALSGSSDSTLKWWDLESGKELLSLADYSSVVNSVAISTDGKRALSGSYDSTLKWWDLHSDKELISLVGHNSCVNSVAISPDGKRALSGADDNTLKWWDLDSGKELRTLEGHSSCVNSVAISPDGKRALSGSRDNTLRWWNLGSGKCLATFTGDHSFYCCAIGADGRSIVAGDAAGTIHFFSVVGDTL